VSQQHRITADKREIEDFPKLPAAISFIRETLSGIAARHTSPGAGGKRRLKSDEFLAGVHF